ncbi:MAG: TauD/TfdA family dioxygenase [Candidatus Kapaibacterium sp.]
MIKESPSLPPHQDNAFAWYGPEMAKSESQWITMLTRNEIKELESAAELVIASGKKTEEITTQDFPLPTLTSKLLKLKAELMKGKGFALFRGLPVEKYSEEESGIIFYGIGAHLGKAKVQNAQGHLLGHVRDLGMSSTDPNVRVYQTKERQTFHTDSADVVGLLCLKTAKRGGLSMLVSSTTIFNEMRKQRPDLLQLLFEPVATDRRGEIPPGMLPYFLIPVFNYYQGYLTAIYQRQYIDSAQRFSDAPRLTEKHIEALDMFDALANSPEQNFSMELKEGDMQFVYNHTLLHDRTAFEDWPDDARKRHLLRLWLAIPGDRPLPEIFATKFSDRMPVGIV